MDIDDCCNDNQEEKKLEYNNNDNDDSNSSSRLKDSPRDSLASTNGLSNHDHFRMEMAWAQAETHYEKKKQLLIKSSKPADSHHVSPLMARSFEDSKPNGVNTNEPICVHNNKQANAQSSLNKKPSKSFLKRYRSFLQKHEPSLDILERIMERFVFYRYLFSHDHHRGIKIELYYAAWNIIRWINDVVLMGWGEGMGMTIGRRDEWLGERKENLKAKQAWSTSFQEWVLSRMHVVVPVLRAVLAATTCVYPALEAWSRRPISSRPNVHGTALPYDESLQQQEDWRYATTTDLCPRTRRLQWESRESRAANLSYWVERIKFVSRFALLSISWWARCRRHNSEDVSNGRGNNEEKVNVVPSLLRRGGELDPCEELLPLHQADAAAAVIGYKGKRTGRRSISTTSMAPSSPLSSPTKATHGSSFVRYLNELISSKNNILYFHVVGELLHILRPFYWSRAESLDWQRRASPASVTNNNQTVHRTSAFSLSLWKAWVCSLIMDIISDELLDITTGCKSHLASNRKTTQRPSLLSRATTRKMSYSPVSSVHQAEQDELTWRRSRRSMYLLRSPVYKAVTLPIMIAVTKVLSRIPSFGVGRWASEYILDMMSYWNEHRFMLE